MDLPDITIRDAVPADHEAIRGLNRAAFDGPDEAAIVDALRSADGLILELVAERQGSVVGHIAFSEVRIEGAYGVAGLAPMAVAPAVQRRGVGSQLVNAGLERLRGAKASAVVVLGHPKYYPRFGFRRASAFGLRWDRACPDEALMALELRPGALASATDPVLRFRPEFG